MFTSSSVDGDIVAYIVALNVYIIELQVYIVAL